MARRPVAAKTSKAGVKLPKTLQKMLANPKDDWRIEQVVTVAEKVGLHVQPPKGGSHYAFSSVYVTHGHVTVPYKRPIKPLYIRLFAEFCCAHLQMQEDDNGK